MGKVIGGGMPVGAYGGRKDIMMMVAPAGPMYQAGTLSGNPLAMVAGLKVSSASSSHVLASACLCSWLVLVWTRVCLYAGMSGMVCMAWSGGTA